jgi:O-antigen/teichoic acid export membrane protein
MSARRALGLTAITRGVAVALSFATVVIVSRLLAPEQIGIFSVSVALVGIGHVFRDFGVAHYLLQVSEVTAQRKRAAFTVTLAASWLVALVLVVLHPLANRFYGDGRIGEVMLVLAINFVLLPFGAPLRTLLQRDLQFGKLAVVNLSNHLTQSGVTIAAAWFGSAHLSMAWGSIAGNFANVVVLLLVSPRGALDWPTHRGLREVLSFGGKSTTASLASAAGSAAPDLVLGRTLGFADVAFYSRAKGLIGMALDQLMVVVSTVYTPTFAKGVREGCDPAALYVQTTALLLGITVPVIALLAVLAPSLVVGLFGESWSRSGPLGSLFCIYALITAPFALSAASLVAVGQIGTLMRARLWIEGARVAVLFSSLVLALEQVVALLGIVYVLEALQFAAALRARLDLKLRALMAAAWRSYALGALTVVVPLLLVLFAPLPTAALIPVATVAALPPWLAGLWLLRHPLRSEVLVAARSRLTRGGTR